MSHIRHTISLEQLKEAVEEKTGKEVKSTKDLLTICSELDELLNTSPSIFSKRSVHKFFRKDSEIL